MANNFVSFDKLALFLDKVKGLIPSKMSQLLNDSNYVQDANYVHSDNNFDAEAKAKLAGIADNANNYTLPIASETILGGLMIGATLEIDAQGKVNVKAIDWANVNGKPTKLSEFTNDSGFITKSVNDLTNYYTKSNTYTKQEITDLIAAKETITYEFPENGQLPATGNSHTFYFIPNGSSANNSYDEYAWIESSSKFEKIGSTDIDLSGYWAKNDLVEVTDAQINSLFSA